MPSRVLAAAWPADWQGAAGCAAVKDTRLSSKACARGNSKTKLRSCGLLC
jgi:hypothetical protein